MDRWEAKAKAYAIAREALRKAMETDMLWGDETLTSHDINLIREECEYLLAFVIDTP